jgi:hypothetical protein
MFLPVQIPTALEHEGTQSSRCVAGLFAPMHTLMLLSSGPNQVVAFFDVSAADVVALRPTFSVIGDIRLGAFQIVDQLVEFFEAFGLWAVLLQDSDGLLYLPTPHVCEASNLLTPCLPRLSLKRVKEAETPPYQRHNVPLRSGLRLPVDAPSPWRSPSVCGTPAYGRGNVTTKAKRWCTCAIFFLYPSVHLSSPITFQPVMAIDSPPRR